MTKSFEIKAADRIPILICIMIEGKGRRDWMGREEIERVEEIWIKNNKFKAQLNLVFELGHDWLTNSNWMNKPRSPRLLNEF